MLADTSERSAEVGIGEESHRFQLTIAPRRLTPVETRIRELVEKEEKRIENGIVHHR